MPNILIDAAHIPHQRAAQLFSGVDAAYPQGPEYARILAMYIGGPDALHTWTPEMANHYLAANPATVFLPIWVDSQCSYPNGAESGLAAVKAAKTFGWAAHMPGDERRWIVVDAETNTNYTYYADCARVIWDEGFRMLAYRSLSTQGPVSADLLWAADWTGVRPSFIPWAGQQYAAGQVWDLDVFSLEVFTGCGRGARK